MENSIKHTYHIDGMSCEGCATTVKNKLSDSPGVTSVQIDLSKKEAEIISSQAISFDKLDEALSNTGYTIFEKPNHLDKKTEVKKGGSCCD
jgi:copper chaperone CopZ